MFGPSHSTPTPPPPFLGARLWEEALAVASANHHPHPLPQLPPHLSPMVPSANSHGEDEDVDVEDFQEKDRGGRNNLKVEKEDLAL